MLKLFFYLVLICCQDRSWTKIRTWWGTVMGWPPPLYTSWSFKSRTKMVNSKWVLHIKNNFFSPKPDYSYLTYSLIKTDWIFIYCLGREMAIWPAATHTTFKNKNGIWLGWIGWMSFYSYISKNRIQICSIVNIIKRPSLGEIWSDLCCVLCIILTLIPGWFSHTTVISNIEYNTWVK